LLAAAGKSMVKVQPFLGKLRARISPPLAATAFRLLESPSPSPERSLLRRSPKALKQVCHVGKASTPILDLDQDVAPFLPGPEHDPPGGGGVLEGVVQQVHQRGSEELRIHVQDQHRVDAVDHQLDLPRVRVHLCGDGDLAHEASQGHPTAAVEAGFEPDLRQRAVDEVPQPDDATGQHRGGASAEAHCAPLQRLERCRCSDRE
jgi:hypothetical protein